MNRQSWIVLQERELVEIDGGEPSGKTTYGTWLGEVVRSFK